MTSQERRDLARRLRNAKAREYRQSHLEHVKQLRRDSYLRFKFKEYVNEVQNKSRNVQKSI